MDSKRRIDSRLAAKAGKILLYAMVLSGCANRWPEDAPPVTYSGTVLNAPLHRGEPDATIYAVRPGVKPGLLDHYWLQPADEADGVMATAHSRKNGDFVLTTKSGYATELWAASQDGRLVALVDRDLKRGTTHLVLNVRPEIQDISYGTGLTEKQIATLRSACDKIMFHYTSTGYKTCLSFSGYREKSIISAEEFQLLKSLAPHLTGSKPDIEIAWPKEVLRVRSFDQPIWFKPQESLFPLFPGL